MKAVLRSRLLFFVFTGVIGVLFSGLQGCTHIEKRHRQACTQLVKLAQELDTKLAEPREDEEYRSTRVTLSGGAQFIQGEGAKISGRNQAKIPLPALKDKWGVIIGGESDREGQLSSLKDRDYESFIRFFNKQDRWMNWDFDVGLKYSSEFKYFARIRGIHTGWFHCSQYRFIHRFYWRNKDGFGTKSRFEMDQQLTEKSMLREFFELGYGETTEGISVYGGIYIRAKATEKLAWSIELLHHGNTDPWEYRYFNFATRIRRSIYWDWLELEIAPEFRITREDHMWDLEPGVEVFLNLTFDAEHIK